jgi:hypothetical protein
MPSNLRKEMEKIFENNFPFQRYCANKKSCAEAQLGKDFF